MKNEIIQIKMGKSNAYLVQTKHGYILVDAGIKGKENIIKETLEKNNATLKDIKLIIITHVHYDHVGSLSTLKSLSGAQVMVHREEYELLCSGVSDFPKGTMKFSKVISNIANKLTNSKFEGVQADILIDDTYDLSIFGVDGEVIHTPGHTLGSICIMIEEEHLICGDTFFNVFKESVYPPFANVEKELLKSWIRIKEKDPTLIYPGHGDVFYKRKFIKSLEDRIIQ